MMASKQISGLGQKKRIIVGLLYTLFVFMIFFLILVLLAPQINYVKQCLTVI